MTPIRAAVFRKAYEPVSIETVEIDAPQPGEVLVRTVASGVCHSDLHYVDGENDIGPMGGPDGTVLGHEGAGIVEAVGENVTYVRPGDHVVACVSMFCGTCDQCLGGNPARCRTSFRDFRRDRLKQDGRAIVPFVGLGTYAEKMLLAESNLVKIPHDVPLDSAALLGCGVTTGFGAALNTAQVRPGSRVAVFGCGGVGLSIVQGAHLAGANVIIAVDQFASKREMALAANATHFVDASSTDAVAAIRDIAGGVDYAFEAVGLPVLVRRCVESLDTGGMAVVVGVQPTGSVYEIPTAALGGEKSLKTCTMGSNRFRVDIPKWLDFYRQGRLRLDEMVSARRPLGDLNEAFRSMRAGEVARNVLVFDQDGTP
jgi:S-(hydroxymethyl)glutathione dehydrogenase/alcohol dehydrogenase